MTLAPRFKTLQKVDSDANGNIKFNVEGQEGGKDYSVTISKMAQFMYESEPHSIEFKLDEKGNVKVLDTEEKYNMTFTVYENDQTHIYDEFKKLYEEAINYLKNQKFEDTEDAKTAIKNLEDVIEASKKEIEETIPIYAEGKIEQLKKAMAELKKYEVKEETEPTDKPQPKPETKPETKPEVKPGNKIFEGVEIQRQSGINRYKTAVEISKKNFNSAETVILVNGMTEADALSASVLAKEKNAPILLIEKDVTPEEVKQEIERLGAKNIIVIGGNSSVSKKATEDLKQKVDRQPFPGPGLAIRVMGEITKEKLDILRDADKIFRDELEKAKLKDINQYFAVLTNNRTVGVMGDFRTYDYTLALRAVSTTDFMTADFTRIPWEILDKVSTRIVNEVNHINRIVYDITSKPPATIEWE